MLLSRLSEKDLVLIKTIYRKLVDKFYQTNTPQAIEHLICLNNITQSFISTPAEANSLSIASLLQILKAKSKSAPDLLSSTQRLITYLSGINQSHKFNNEPLIKGISLGQSCSQIFTLSCTIMIRFREKCMEILTEDTVGLLGKNSVTNISLSIQLLLGIVQLKSESVLKSAIKSGMLKYIINTYLANVCENGDKLNLYKALKLLKVASSVDKNILREREKHLSLVIYKYEQYIPIIKDALENSIDQQYNNSIFQQPLPQSIDKLYLWTHHEQFSIVVLSKAPTLITKIIQLLKKQTDPITESKIFAILANLSKYNKKCVWKGPWILPKNQKSVKSCLKLLLTSPKAQLKQNEVNWGKLQKLADQSNDPMVPKLLSEFMGYLGDNKKIKHLDQSLLDIFSERNAELLMDRAGRIPLNKDDLEKAREILSAKQPRNQFEADCLTKAKDLVLNALFECILTSGNKLITASQMNLILKSLDLTNISHANKIIQMLQNYLMQFPQAIDHIDKKIVRDIIRFIENQCLKSKQTIDWGAPQQVLQVLYPNHEWEEQNNFKSALIDLTDCYWLLSLVQPTRQQINKIVECLKSKDYLNPKLAMIIGFLSKGNQEMRDAIIKQLYKTHITKMIKCQPRYPEFYQFYSFLINRWNQCQNKQIKSVLEKQLIPEILNLIVNDPISKNSEQACIFLSKSLPLNNKNYPYNCLMPDILLTKHGHLAQFVYQHCSSIISNPNIYEQVKFLSKQFEKREKLNGQQLNQVLSFVQEQGKLSQKDPLNQYLTRILELIMSTQNKYTYWKLYPHYFNIIKHFLNITNQGMKSQNIKIKTQQLLIMQRLTETIITNEHISEEQYEELIQQIISILQDIYHSKDQFLITNINVHKYFQIFKQLKYETNINVNFHNIIVDIEKMKDKIKQKKVIEKNNNKFKENQREVSFLKSQELSQLKSANEIKKEQKTQNILKTISLKSQIIQIDQLEKQNLQSTNKNIKVQISIPSNLNQGQLTVLQAIIKLQKIIQTKNNIQILPSLLEIFATCQIIQKYRGLLGDLLAQVYHLSQQQLILQLLLNKTKTCLSLELCYVLLCKWPQAFILSRRWKLFSRQFLILAVERMDYKPYRADAFCVAEYNLIKISEVEFFQSKNYHHKVLKLISDLTTPQQICYYLLLVGTSAKLSDIRIFYLKQNLYISIIKLMSIWNNHAKILANGSFALSSIIYMQPVECLKLVKQNTNQLNLVLVGYTMHSKVKAVVEAGCCFLANITYNNEQIKIILEQSKLIESIMKMFVDNLQSHNPQTYKHILRAIGNCSSKKQFGVQLINRQIGKHSMTLVQKLQILLYLNDSTSKVLKLLVDVFSNLSIHKHQIMAIHKSGITQFVLHLLETTELNPQIIMGCIDTIDGLCQQPQVQNYAVREKKLPYILIDLLKTQEDQKLITKSIRLLTNLTIHAQLIPIILEANLLSIIANIILLNHHNNKIQIYVSKMIIRVYNSNQPMDLLLKSGYLDCLVRAMETQSSIQQSYVSMMSFYSHTLPNFLNKRAFMCMIKVLSTKATNKEMVEKSIQILKILMNMSTDKDQEDVVIEGSPTMYQTLIPNYPVDMVYLLGSHCIRSKRLRVMLRQTHPKVVQILKSDYFFQKVTNNMGNQQKFMFENIVHTVIFVIYNDPEPLVIEPVAQQEEKAFKHLKNGFKCKLFRNDGSSKKAMIKMTSDYVITAFKYPDGQVKNKYKININQIRDWHFYYNLQTSDDNNLWKNTLFYKKSQGFFNETIDPSNCVTLMGGLKWGEFVNLNVQFQNGESKNFFIVSLMILMRTFGC